MLPLLRGQWGKTKVACKVILEVQQDLCQVLTDVNLIIVKIFQSGKEGF